VIILLISLYVFYTI